MRNARLVAVLTSLLLAACDSTTAANRFQASDFFGEWRLQVAETGCWAPLDIAFAIDRSGVEREGPGLMSFSSRWGAPTDSARTRFVEGYIYWKEPQATSFQLAFFQNGVLLGQLAAGRNGLSADRFEGIFFDPNRQSCQTDAVAVKVGT